MLVTFVLLSTLAAPPEPRDRDSELVSRTVSVAITGKDGRAVENLSLQDIALVEDGQAREVSRLVPDERPLRVLLLVDSSESVGASLRLNLVEPLVRLLEQLPEGTRYALWKTGDRPTRLVDWSTDRTLGRRALERLFPMGGNTILDALVEAGRTLKTEEGGRTAVVAVSASGPEFSSRTRERVVDEAQPLADTFYSVLIDQPDAVERPNDVAYSYVFTELARRSGGLHEPVLTAMTVSRSLSKLGADLSHRYRLSYLGAPRRGKLELQLARPDTRLRLVEAPEARR